MRMYDLFLSRLGLQDVRRPRRRSVGEAEATKNKNDFHFQPAQGTGTRFPGEEYCKHLHLQPAQGTGTCFPGEGNYTIQYNFISKSSYNSST